MSSWSGVAEAYRVSFSTLSAGTIAQLLADTEGTYHLDVGCGAGGLAAQASGLGRRVVAVDADADMVALTRSVQPHVVRAALPDLPFADDEFDAVTTNFVLNHVGNPLRSARELARVVRPGGRVAATIWPAQPQRWAQLVNESFAAAGVIGAPVQHLPAELDFERSAAGFAQLFERADLHPEQAIELTWQWDISVENLWVGIAGGVAAAGQTFLAQSRDVQRAAAREFKQRAEEVASSGVLRLDSRAVYVVGSK